MKKKIKLNSRYELNNYLQFYKQVNNELYYRFVSDLPYRIIYDSKNRTKPAAIDPAGGPMMYVGSSDIINGFTLTRIHLAKKYSYLIFKEIEQND